MGSGVNPLAIATRSSKHEMQPGGMVPPGLVIWSCLSTSRALACRCACKGNKDQADRVISTGKLHTLLRFNTRPINVVVYHDSHARPSFEVGFPLRCFQRLSLPYIATRLCRWRDNRSTRGTSIPVLSY